MYKRAALVGILALGILCTVLFLGGVFTSIQITSASNKNTATEEEANQGTQSTKEAVVDPGKYNILVLGDSLAKGTGDEKGQGFANDFAALWKSNVSKEIKVNNMAINGDTSLGLLQVIKNEQTARNIESANLILISIGGNEIKNFQNTELSSALTELKTVQDRYTNNLKEIYKTIRSKNKGALIVFVGLYNPFDKEITADKIKLLNDWNYGTEQLITGDSNSIFIPTYDLFRYNLDKYLSVDHFHPNAAGYSAISKRMYEVLNNYGK